MLLLLSDERVRTDFISQVLHHQRLPSYPREKCDPSFFQHYIDKEYDIRVVMIGEGAFATEIHAHSAETHVDFRVDYSRLSYRVHQLPEEIEQQLRVLHVFYQLSFSAINFVRDHSGRYYFLELNPSGQFAWVEEPTDLLFHVHLAQLLVNGGRKKEPAYATTGPHELPETACRDDRRTTGASSDC